MIAIEISHLGYTYNPKSPYEKRALNDISLSIEEGDVVAVVGQTGSGKSTLMQHLNGLIKHTEGSIRVYDVDLNARKPQYKRLRELVGMVFQYPEYQLFDETVEKDVGFGCRNAKLSPELTAPRVRAAIEAVGLDYGEVATRSPFELSGGQKRRVALAGVIAMQPKILVLDEPTAGLDPVGKQDILHLVRRLHERVSPTIVMVSHDMEAVAQMATRVLVLHEGKLVFDTTPKELFTHHEDELVAMGLDLPVAVQVANRLRAKGWAIGEVITPDELADEVRRIVGGGLC